MNISHSAFISPSKFSNKVIERNGELGITACEILTAAINAVNPYQCVSDLVHLKGDHLQVGEEKLNLEQFKRIILIGFGKASVLMAKAILDILGDRIDSAKVITKDDKFLTEIGYHGDLQVRIGDHPVPGQKSIEATRNLFDELPRFEKQDLVLVVISGGGSALLTSPVPGIRLEDIQAATQVLLRCGAEISEINTIRKHLDQVKGGQLARFLYPAQVHSLILSDVIGDRLDMIASGPTSPDPTTFSDALSIVDKYQLRDLLPITIVSRLEDGKNGKIPETPKLTDEVFAKVHNHIVGTNLVACEAAQRCAEKLGYRSMIVSSQITGMTQDVARTFDRMIQSVIERGDPIKPSCCLILGGETTVEVKGRGLGGRNQDLALHMVRRISKLPGVLFISLATDGEDGPTDAAGAVVDHQVFEESQQINQLDLDEIIQNNDSYRYFQKTGGLIKIGSTGTNVNDLMMIFIDQDR